MAERTRRDTGHNTVWRCEANACHMVADIYDREAAMAYRDLLNVIASTELPRVRFEVVEGAGFWKDRLAFGHTQP